MAIELFHPETFDVRFSPVCCGLGKSTSDGFYSRQTLIFYILIRLRQYIKFYIYRELLTKDTKFISFKEQAQNKFVQTYNIEKNTPN